MATENQFPDVLLASANYTAPAVADIDDDPNSPDGNWLVWDGNGNTDCLVSFPTPTGPPTVGASLQEFRVQIRKSAAGGNAPDWSFELWEDIAGTDTLVAVLATGTTTIEDPGEVVSGIFNASLLTTADGSLAELKMLQTNGGSGSPANRRGLEVGAVKWIVDYSTGTPVSNTMSGGVEAIASVSQSPVLPFEAKGAPIFPYHIIKEKRRDMRAMLTL